MSDNGGRVALMAEIDALDGSQNLAVMDRFVMMETVSGGWQGTVSIDAPAHEGVRAAFDRNIDRRFHPSKPVGVGLWLATGEDEASATTPLRDWPSMVTKLTTTTGADGRVLTHVHFRDTLTYLGEQHVWGVLADCSLAEAIGGAISLAAGGDGSPTTSPVTPNMPPVTLRQSTREALVRLPYVVAAGETLDTLVARLLERLGARYEMLGQVGDVSIEVWVKDGPPTGDPLGIALGPGHASASNGVLASVVNRPRQAMRDTVLDTPLAGMTRRVLGQGPVGALITGADVDLEEATLRASFAAQGEALAQSEARLVTGQPGLRPGRRLRLGRAVDGAEVWQVGTVVHRFEHGEYLNTSYLWKDGAAWRASRRPQGVGATVVTGVVNDGLPDGEVVERDRLGRVPVSLQMDYAAPLGAGLAGWSPASVTNVRLPVIDPLAGGVHGFVPQHRQGDRCRIAVSHPLSAEVVGFVYDDARGIPEAADGTGIVVDHQPGAWQGMLFGPPKDDED